MAAKTSVMGINRHDHSTRRTRNIRISAAKKVRQNANRIPRASTGQSAKIGAFAKKPLVLHMTAATTISNRPRHTLAGEFVVTIPCLAQHQSFQGIATSTAQVPQNTVVEKEYAGDSGFAQQRADGYFLRCRIFARIRRFLRPILRRPLPVFFVPT